VRACACVYNLYTVIFLSLSLALSDMNIFDITFDTRPRSYTPDSQLLANYIRTVLWESAGLDCTISYLTEYIRISIEDRIFIPQTDPDISEYLKNLYIYIDTDHDRILIFIPQNYKSRRTMLIGKYVKVLNILLLITILAIIATIFWIFITTNLAVIFSRK